MTELIQHVLNGLIMGGAYALIGIGLTMILGIMNVINFAHGVIYMLGAYIVYTLSTLLGMNFFFALILSLFAVAAIGVMVDQLALRPVRDRDMISKMLATIAVMIIFENLALIIWGSVPQVINHPFQAVAMTFGDFRITQYRLFIAFVAVVMIIGTHLLVQKTMIGKKMRATFQDKEMSALLGIRIDRVYPTTFALGSVMAGVAGVLLGTLFSLKPTMGDFAVTRAFAVVILGGMGSFPGAILGGLVLGVSENLAAAYISSGFKDGIAFILIVVILIFRPSGLLGKKISKK